MWILAQVFFLEIPSWFSFLPNHHIIYIKFSLCSCISVFLRIPNNLQLKLHCITHLHFTHSAQTLAIRSQEVLIICMQHGLPLWKQHISLHKFSLYFVVVDSKQNQYLFQYNRLACGNICLCACY
jgi:hypothetical protein